MTEIQEVKPYKRRKKGGKRKCVEVRGYIRIKPSQNVNEND